MNKRFVAGNTLIIAVIIATGALLATGCGKNKTAGAGQSAVTKNHGGIAYVELDSVIARFDMAKDKATELEEKTKNSEAELASKSQAFDRDVRDFQNKVQKGLVTRATAAEMEQTLQQQQQTLLARRDEMAYNLNEESLVAQRQVLEYINQYLAEFNAERGFSYILAKQFPGPVLYSDTTLDITVDVVAGLNAKYNAEKAKK
jgi:outer membrane protein